MAGQQDTDYLDGESTQGMPGTVLPRARREAESSGAVFDVHAPIQQNIVDGDRVRPLTVEKLEELKRANRSMTGYKTPECKTFDDVLQNTPEIGQARLASEGPKLTMRPPAYPLPTPTVQVAEPEPVEQAVELPIHPVSVPPAQSVAARVAPVAVHEPAPPPPPPLLPQDGVLRANQPLAAPPEDLDLEPDPRPGPERMSSYSVALTKKAAATPEEEEAASEPLINPAMEGGAHAELASGNGAALNAANLKLKPMQVARVKVRFISRAGKLAVPYNVVFKYGMQLIMVQYSPEGMFYEAPSAMDEHIEVQWHGQIFMCLPGVYFVMPDEKTAFTIFLIDDKATIVRRKREEAERDPTRHYQV